MKKEKEQFILKEFSNIFRDYYEKDITQSCMPWGITCGDGWYDIIYNLCTEITTLTKDKNIQVIAEQVKQKLGGLRFYFYIENSNPSKFWFAVRSFFFKHRWGRFYNFLRDKRMFIYKSTEEKIYSLVSKAEMLSYKTCEMCGQPGTTKGGSWVKTICDKCDENQHDPVD